MTVVVISACPFLCRFRDNSCVIGLKHTPHARMHANGSSILPAQAPAERQIILGAAMGIYLCLVVCNHRARLSMGHQHGHWLCWVDISENTSTNTQ